MDSSSREPVGVFSQESRRFQEKKKKLTLSIRYVTLYLELIMTGQTGFNCETLLSYSRELVQLEYLIHHHFFTTGAPYFFGQFPAFLWHLVPPSSFCLHTHTQTQTHLLSGSLIFPSDVYTVLLLRLLFAVALFLQSHVPSVLLARVPVCSRTDSSDSRCIHHFLSACCLEMCS